MQKFVITGGQPLSGTVRIAGAKNAVLKMMAAAALTDSRSACATSRRSATWRSCAR